MDGFLPVPKRHKKNSVFSQSQPITPKLASSDALSDDLKSATNSFSSIDISTGNSPTNKTIPAQTTNNNRFTNETQKGDTNTIPFITKPNSISEAPKLLTAKSKKSFKQRLEILSWRKTKLSKPRFILLWLAIIVFIIAIGYGIYSVTRKTDKPPVYQPPKAKIIVPPKPVTEASRLTGLLIDPALNKRPVTGIMIENSPDARPQSGLNDAGIVYEAIAEGGITRFLALYQESRPQYIGPVRSVRPYYLDFLMPFDGSVAHVGGSPKALSDIKSLGIKDLDQFQNSGSYSRISARFAPHNVYTDFDKLDALNQKRGYNSSNFTGPERKKEAPASQPTAKTIDINISGPLYNVHYDYEISTNSYKRSEGGAPHLDEKSSTQLQPKVVIALVLNRSLDPDGQHTNYITTGSGQMFVFQDGTLTEGTWTKSDRKSPFTFANTNGQPLQLNPGQTWITITDAGSVSSKP